MGEFNVLNYQGIIYINYQHTKELFNFLYFTLILMLFSSMTHSINAILTSPTGFNIEKFTQGSRIIHLFFQLS